MMPTMLVIPIVFAISIRVVTMIVPMMIVDRMPIIIIMMRIVCHTYRRKVKIRPV
jgi:hypothetical protein